MVKWVRVEFHRVVTPKSWQCHLKVTVRSNQQKTFENRVESHLPVRSPMRSDRHYGRFSRPEFILSQSHIKGDHLFGQTTIPDFGQVFVAKWQVHSRHCGKMSIFNISL